MAVTDITHRHESGKTHLDDPSAFWGVVIAVIEALLTLLVAFGLDLSPEQRDAVVKLAIALGPVVPLVTAYLIRRRAYSPPEVRRLLDTQVMGIRRDDLFDLVP